MQAVGQAGGGLKAAQNVNHVEKNLKSLPVLNLFFFFRHFRILVDGVESGGGGAAILKHFVLLC